MLPLQVHKNLPFVQNPSNYHCNFSKEIISMFKHCKIQLRTKPEEESVSLPDLSKLKSGHYSYRLNLGVKLHLKLAIMTPIVCTTVEFLQSFRTPSQFRIENAESNIFTCNSLASSWKDRYPKTSKEHLLMHVVCTLQQHIWSYI